MAYLYPYGDTQQLNLDWLIEQWNDVRSQIDGSLQAEIDRVEAAITDLLTARNEAVAAQTAAQASAQAAAGSASTASGAASTATAQAQAAAGSAATAGSHASNAQTSATNAGLQATAAGNSANAAATSEGNARNSELTAAASSSAAAGNALYAEGYAKGTQNGNPVSSGSPYYENNAKYYSDQAAQDASNATAGAVIKSISNVPIASFDDGLQTAVKQIIIDIDPVQSGSGDPAPDNVRPITGWTGAKVVRTGKNLLPDTVYNYAASGPAIAERPNYRGMYCKVPSSGNYTISRNTVTGNRFRIYAARTLPAVGTPVLSIGANDDTALTETVTVPNGYNYIFIYLSNADDTITSNIQIESGNTASAFEPFAETYNVTFPDAAGTVYGGTLTNEGGEWKLNMTHYYVTLLNSANVSYHSGAIPSMWLVFESGKNANADTQLNAITNMYPVSTSGDKRVHLYGSEIDIFDSDFTDEATARTILATFICVYKLNSPIDYTLTESQALTLLNGTNNVWADTGNINLLQYYANSKKYIDEQDALIKALIAKELPDMTADTALVANDFRIVNNTLYRITASVASGGTLTPGTNCAATTITDVLKTLL